MIDRAGYPITVCVRSPPQKKTTFRSIGAIMKTDQGHLRLLLAEDDADTASLIKETLEDHFGTGCVQVCPTASEAKKVDADTIDMLLTDMNLPDGNGLDILNHFLKQKPDLPAVIITAEGVLDNAIAAIQQGAYDYIVKSGEYLFTIPLIVEKNMAIWRTKQENLHLQQQLAQTLEEVRIKNNQLEDAVHQLKIMAATDPLTGLNNRRSFGQALSRSFAQAQRYHHDLSCVMIDVDNFKLINDTLGHQAGDDLLRFASGILKAQCRSSDVAARFGGDEFILLLPQTDKNTAHQVAQRIHDEFISGCKREFDDWGIADQTSISMGVAAMNYSNPTSPEQLVTHADLALYRAKQAGKNNVAVYNNSNSNSNDQPIIVTDTAKPLQ